MPIDSRAISAAHFALELEGNVVGFLRSVEGGEPFVAVVEGAAGLTGIIAKQRGSVQYAPITIAFGAGMSKALYQWVGSTLDRNTIEKSGAIILADINFNEVSRLTFDNALITEIKFPTFDAAGAKDQATITVTMQPRATRNLMLPGGKISVSAPVAQKAWIASNFRFKIAGLETACTRVSKVNAITVTQAPAREAVGENRFAASKGTLQIGDVSFSASEAVFKDFASWFDEFAFKNGQEKTATVELLSPDLQTVVSTLSLSNVGIIRVRRDKLEASAESAARFSVEMYCESVSFTIAEEPGAPVLAPGTPIKMVGTPPIPIRP